MFICSGTTGLDRNIHARQDPYTQDLAHPDLQSSLVAKGSRIYRHGLVSGKLIALSNYTHSNQFI